MRAVPRLIPRAAVLIETVYDHFDARDDEIAVLLSAQPGFRHCRLPYLVASVAATRAAMRRYFPRSASPAQ
jgi:hypothetical protein